MRAVRGELGGQLGRGRDGSRDVALLIGPQPRPPDWLLVSHSWVLDPEVEMHWATVSK